MMEFDSAAFQSVRFDGLSYLRCEVEDEDEIGVVWYEATENGWDEGIDDDLWQRLESAFQVQGEFAQ